MKPVVRVAGAAQLPFVAQDAERDEADMVFAVVTAALADAGVERKDVGFWCSASCDYALGRPFSFVIALDGAGAWPPIAESHVEMDGAWAFYEAWVHLLMGHVDTAVVYTFGRSSVGPIDEVLTLQLDPYTVAPLRPDPLALAALQARALLDAGRWTERDIAAVVARSERSAMHNAHALRRGEPDIEALLAVKPSASPLRPHDGPARADSACAVVLSTRGSGPRIRGMDHRIEPHALGLRDLTQLPSLSQSATKIGLEGVDLAELHAPYSSQELVLRDVLNLGSNVRINPSGGALCGDTPMVSGLVRIVEAANAIKRGESRVALAHATSGPCLQQNLLCVLEAG